MSFSGVNFVWQILNLILLVLIGNAIYRWFKYRPKKMMDRLDRVEAKLDSLSEKLDKVQPK